MFLENMLNEANCQAIKKHYEHWYTFMEQEVDFWLQDSQWHTKTHCARVLLLALVIGHQKGLSSEELDALAMAAVFHDSRRLDDGIDKRHGQRAAAYYKEYCETHNLAYDMRTYYIIFYHDQDDSLGLLEINKCTNLDERAVLLYQIFKDADALDRVRLGPNNLDTNYLRTKEAHQLVAFSTDLFQKSNEKMYYLE